MPSSEALYSGTLGTKWRLHLDVTLLSQDTANNRSLVRLNAYMGNTVTSNVWNSIATSAQYQYDGNVINTTVNHYGNFGANVAPTNYNFVASNQDVYVYHNADGTKTALFYAYHNGDDLPFLGTSATSFYYTLPTIATIPTVTTTSATSILATTALVGGNVTNSGNATITSRGIYYSTSNANPTSANSTKTVTGTTGAYTTTLTGLLPLTTYYFRAYAINSVGTAYGASSSFTTTVTPYATLQYANTNVYANGTMLRDTGSGWILQTGDLTFETFTNDGKTTVLHSVTDPSDMVRGALDYHALENGSVLYDTSVVSTGTTFTYNFISQTIYEVIQKALELAPSDWYWYVDNATNKLHFKAKDTIPTHKLIMGKDIQSLELNKRAEDIVNLVYFTGGDIGGGSILYKKYLNSYSAGLYGTRATRLVDARVTTIATADQLSNNLLNQHSSAEVRLTVTIADSNPATGAYDIETIQVGDVINIGNITGNIGSSLFDVAHFDVDYFDYNIADINTLNLQIVRKEYTPENIRLTCSTIATDVSKSIDVLNRTLDAVQTALNPDTPT
ncbi:MAG: hypothetical protein WCJ60_01670 [bacterium]